MNNSDETLEQLNQAGTVLQAISELSKKIDDYKKESDTQFQSLQNRFESFDDQFEAIRQGIVHNARFV